MEITVGTTPQVEIIFFVFILLIWALLERSFLTTFSVLTNVTGLYLYSKWTCSQGKRIGLSLSPPFLKWRLSWPSESLSNVCIFAHHPSFVSECHVFLRMLHVLKLSTYINSPPFSYVNITITIICDLPKCSWWK